jgi:hypothetical protein
MHLQIDMKSSEKKSKKSGEPLFRRDAQVW